MSMSLRLTDGGRLLRAAVMLIVAGILVALATRLVTASLTPALSFAVASYGPATYADALRIQDAQVELGEERVARTPDAWAAQESLARALMARARLSGGHDDLVRAGKALARARESAPAGAGPILTQAVYSLLIHDLSAAATASAQVAKFAVPAPAEERAEAAAIAGDVAFYRGDYAAASRAYAAIAAGSADAATAFRMAVWQRKLGNPAAAAQLLRDAARQHPSRTPQFMATMELAIGATLLDRGEWSAARAAFDRAADYFPGYWLADAHRAQMLAVAGDVAGAERVYRAILARNPQPSVMDALASLYRSQGRIAEMQTLAARAGRLWAQRLATLPDATRGHMVEHLLVFGDRRRALALARADYRARPYGETATLLAAALLANARASEADRVLTDLVATGWRTAQAHALLAQARAMRGDSAGAADARAAALAINPRAFDGAASLIWFGHH